MSDTPERVQAYIQDGVITLTEPRGDHRGIVLVPESRLAALEAERAPMCSVCAGTGKPVSGLPCICGGRGTQLAELQGFREQCYDLRAERDALVPLARIAEEILRHMGRIPSDEDLMMSRELFDVLVKDIPLAAARAILGRVP